MAKTIFNDPAVFARLKEAFPQSFLNMRLEFIAHIKRNSYFLMKDVKTETELKCKVLEWLSREACKGGGPKDQKYHLDGINCFLGTKFTHEEIEEVYTWLGNSVNRDLTLAFIKSGYDMKIFERVG